MLKKRQSALIALSGVAAGLALAGPTLADSAATIESDSSGSDVTLDNTAGTPVVTNILSQPTTVDGYTYSYYAFLVNDGTGSLDIFSKLTGLGYTPTVGDGITVSGEYSPYDSIPEVENLSSISAAYGSGNPVPAPTSVTVPELNAITPSSFNILGEYLSLDDVTFTDLNGATNFPTHANATYDLTDGDGNSVEAYIWASSYSTVGAYGGTAIPTGPLDVTGFADSYDGTTEFVPLTFTAAPVPEPASLSLLGLGAAALVTRRRGPKGARA